MPQIDHLIINNPYRMPEQFWDTKTFEKKSGRRKAGFLFVSKDYDDSTEFYELTLVNKIRKRVDIWRENNYPGITNITKKLLDHWNNSKMREHQFFFCQLEAIETIIWLTEGPEDSKQGIEIPNDGGPFKRICSKMATGSGKTAVMGMLITWQVINKVTYPTDTRFTRNFLVMAPNLTVKQVLSTLKMSNEKKSIYDEFNIIPIQFMEKFSLAKIIITNWHTLMPDEDKKYSVVQLGPESNEVFTKRILGNTLSWNNLIVINDEAHHAWRPNSAQNVVNNENDEEEAKIWIQGLEKIHDARNILTCYDFSATPMMPSGSNKSEQIFDWIVSDFSLTDAIESGLVKTPRITVTEDSNDGRQFYHIYSDEDVQIDIRNKNRKPEEPLPALVKNAYIMLGQHWKKTRDLWKKNKRKIPPVMISVCNNIGTATRVEYSFKNNKFGLDAFLDDKKIIRIDSQALEKKESDGSADATEILLRKKIDTVGQLGMPGEEIENIVAVAMLSEGWDAHNVTHIMGLRAFSSQLLCEQVIGRGLRRTSYEIDEETGLFSPEFVTIFGIPYAFLPHEYDSAVEPSDEKPSTYIESVGSKIHHKISWPNIIRVNTNYSPKLTVDWKDVGELGIDSKSIIGKNAMAPALEGKTSDKISIEDLEKLGTNFRLQTIIYQTTKDIFEQIKISWEGDKQFLLLQLVNIVEKFITSGKIKILNLPSQNEILQKIVLMIHMDKVVRYIVDVIKVNNTESRHLEFDPYKEVMSTADIRPWYSTKTCVLDVTKSHLNHSPYDKGWEKDAIEELESNPNVISWVKNDRGLFAIEYNWYGKPKQYWPDFIIRLKNGKMLILEIKGIDEPEGKEKRSRLNDWVNAVNQEGRFGNWTWSVAFDPEQVNQIILEKTDLSLSDKIFAKCLKCKKQANSRRDVNTLFGFQNIDGFTNPQSLCKECH